MDWLVSIHAFRGEGDALPARPRALFVGFNPRLPGGRRLRMPAVDTVHDLFQSTPSGGKATRRLGRPLARVQGFNPRLPGGRRLNNTRQIAY